MEHLHYEFDAPAGAIVEVTLDRRANVLLLDSANYQRYRRLERFEYRGGEATSSPVRLPVPGAGHWHVAIDLGGAGGHIRTSARLIR